MDIFSTWHYALFCANIHHFNSQLPWQNMQELYLEWIKHHEKKPLKTDTSWNLQEVKKMISKKPSIICLYHLGYHGQIPFVLAENNIKYDVLMDRSVYEKQQEQFLMLQSKFKGQGNSYNILFSDDIHVLLKARTAIREGRHLLVFADGNSGAVTEKLNRAKVSFLNSEIQVRKGIAVLSYLLKTPIIPLMHRKANGCFILEAGDPIYPNSLLKGKREDYIHYSLQRLYFFLEEQISDKLYLWEGWGYLHEMKCFEINDGPYSDYDFKQPEFFIPLQLKGQSGYFDCKNYRFIINSS
jgi:lauroyl/myristoyl acyltransferase